MMVRLRKPWGQWSKGHVIPAMAGGQARTLISRGIAEEVADDNKAFEAPANRMLIPDAQDPTSARAVRKAKKSA